MPESTRKSFADLHDDYAFFEAHATEARAGVASWRPHLREAASRPGPLRMLDFGAGSGSYLAMVLEDLGLDPSRLRLALVEPDEGFRALAVERLGRFTAHPVEVWPLQAPGEYDLVLSHHVLYYVPDLAATLRWLAAALAPGGRMLLAQGGGRNGLNVIMRRGFDLLGEPPPYMFSEDTEAELRRSGVPYRREDVPSEVRFPDSEENRWRILRFLLGEHAARVPAAEALAAFDSFLEGSEVVLRSVDDLFVVTGGPGARANGS